MSAILSRPQCVNHWFISQHPPFQVTVPMTPVVFIYLNVLITALYLHTLPSRLPCQWRPLCTAAGVHCHPYPAQTECRHSAHPRRLPRRGISWTWLPEPLHFRHCCEWLGSEACCTIFFLSESKFYETLCNTFIWVSNHWKVFTCLSISGTYSCMKFYGYLFI